MKVVNFEALLIVELLKMISLKLGQWIGDVDFFMVRIDDFDVVLGMEFLLKHRVSHPKPQFD